MNDRDDTAAELPRPRHAAPRAGLRSRIRGRALAIAAVPTALIVGAAYTPSTLAVADTSAGKACASAPDTVLEETPVPKSQIKVIPAPTATGKAPVRSTKAPVKAPTATATAKSSTVLPKVQQGTAAAAAPAAPTAAPSPSASATAEGSHGIIGDILDGILHPGGPTPTPKPTPTPTTTTGGSTRTTTTPAPPTATRSDAPTAPVTTAPSATAPSGGASASSAASGGPSAPTPSASPTGPNCILDTSGVSAKAAGRNDVVPDQNWTLHSSRLALHGSVFNGVYDVRTPTGTKRVLKFTTASVDIGDLDMSTIMTKGNTFHVKGGPGTTSTMRNGPITMYVESLSGHLSAIYGLPIPIDLGEITLTPDTLPKWLWDLIGAVPIPLDITLDKAKAVQAGQFGGTLKIPGMKLYQDQSPYDG
ncbi:hypothetical protein [Kitasatospora sp. NPDC059571]|uniref:hypothetical protein n=1 Tax=Kitasatospora sp. NPDC059571 TaxID=3346871 RepID=UPI00369A445D